ncbi:HEPN domain-containing protein [Dysgonomonas sp. HDW5B]|uniref:HEPN domain-containing protein n=1 Tax=Dysgonomonas sp. HDW5B TaxID=2714927 RepID=UPI00140A4AC2|nr:HEPN domain-containing protein [Dysgonomonas sp. HDW5B]QIK53121.1 HEPN domain-containing protein [Dysgonomonas sp. HDW5B]
MKKSIAYLPKHKQEDLNFLVQEINKRLPQAEMIILYGSYARNEFVDYDERVEFGITTTYMSDYDILVVTSGIADKNAGHILDNIDDLYYKDPDKQTPVNFINDDIKKLNKDLEEGRYFYTQIKEEGVMLYDSGKFKLARRRKLNFDEIKQQAQEYFNDKFDNANGFLRNSRHAYNDNDYKLASFLLHQACENYYYSIRLVHTLKSNKQHNLTKLTSSVKRYSPDLATVFPLNTVEEKRLFNLIKAAYVEARYNPKFLVTKEDIDALIPKVELLRDITKRICEVKIGEYGEMG